MSAPLRFLSVVVIGWVALRATALDGIPGFTISAAEAAPVAPIAATSFPPIEGSSMAEAPQWPAATPPQMMPYPAAYRPVALPYYVPAYVSAPAPHSELPISPRPSWSLASLGPAAAPFALDSYDYSGLPPLRPATSGGHSVPLPPPPPAKGLDRWEMSSWALLRGAPVSGTLASGGTLGGSQAGARVTYVFNRSLAASVRTSSPIGGSRGAEVAAGIRWAPLQSIPVAITAERRQSISRFGGGRSDFALFVEGGLYRQSMPMKFELDAYGQAGIVGINERDLFADGALSFTRPIYGRFSGGFGLWGGYQPGIYRIDAGPRVTVRVRDNIKAHVDWRQRLAGSAQPDSGPALTLAADF